MRKLRFILDRHSLEKIYMSFIRPLLEYGDVNFDNCTSQEKETIEKVQYEAARIVTGATKLVSIAKLMSEVGWESLESRRNQHKLVLFYKMTKYLAPPYLSEMLQVSTNEQSYNLRNQNCYRAPRARTMLYYNFFLPSTTRAFNSLQSDVRSSPTLSSFNRVYLLTFKSHRNIFTMAKENSRFSTHV
jgi:hypothetical protein